MIAKGYGLEAWFAELCEDCNIPPSLREEVFRMALAHEWGQTPGDIHRALSGGGTWFRSPESGKLTFRKSNAASSTPSLPSGMSSKSSELEWTFTASWPVDSTGSLLIKRNQLREELESSLNCLADTAQEQRLSYARHEPAPTVRLYVSQTPRGFKRVICIETHIPASPSCGDTENSASSTSEQSRT